MSKDIIKCSVLNTLSDFTHIKKIQESNTLEEDLSMDSLDIVEFTMRLEEHFYCNISDATIVKWKTVSDVITYIQDNQLNRMTTT